MMISWRPYVRHVSPEVDPHALTALEHRWGVTLPADYKHLVSKHQGMAPSPSAFNIGKAETSLGVLLTVTREERQDEYSILSTYDSLRRYGPDRLYPFGITPSDEPLCFDYREPLAQPRIVLVSVEGSVYPVANSFTEFLSLLHD
jgi:hypothetical protein